MFENFGQSAGPATTKTTKTTNEAVCIIYALQRLALSESGPNTTSHRGEVRRPGAGVKARGVGGEMWRR